MLGECAALPFLRHCILHHTVWCDTVWCNMQEGMMSGETRWTLVVGLLGTLAVTYLALYAERHNSWIEVSILVGVACLVIVKLIPGSK